jgi:hypothetical protein
MKFIPLICLLFSTTTTHLLATPAAEIELTAKRFIQSLDDGQKSRALFSNDDQHRRNWDFLPDRSIKPNGRLGLPIKDMNKGQRLLAHAMLSAALSNKGYIQATSTMMLEQILFDLEGQNAIRNPELYYVSVFGTPAASGHWGWRFEGHHMSINISIKDGKHYSVTPSFFGSNPGEVREGVFEGLRVLGEEEELGRSLIKSLTEEQKGKAIIMETAPRDIITKQHETVEAAIFSPAKGIHHDDLNDVQRTQLLRLIEIYVEKYRPEMVAEITARRGLSTDKITFAWAGGIERGEPHYYRVQTEKFLFEYDNVQNGANHVHSVWRDFEGDFGADLLKQHYEAEHQEK